MITEDLVEYIRTNCYEERDGGCERCTNYGDCCLQCDFRKDCPSTCLGEWQHKNLEKMSDGELADRLDNEFESAAGLLMMTAAERIRELSKQVEALNRYSGCSLHSLCFKDAMGNK